MQSLHRAAGLKNNGDEKGTQGENQVKLSWEKTRAPGAETGERQRELAMLEDLAQSTLLITTSTLMMWPEPACGISSCSF